MVDFYRRNISFLKNSAVLIIATTSIIIVFWFLLYLYIFPSIEETANTSLKTNLELIKQNTLEDLNKPISELTDLAERPNTVTTNPELISAFIKKGFEDHQMFDQISMLDHNLNHKRSIINRPLTITEKKPFIQIEDTTYHNGTFLSPFEYSLNSKEPYISIYTPIKNAIGKYSYIEGTLKISTHFFNPTVINEKLGKTGKIFLFDREGNLFSDEEHLPFTAETKEKLRELVKNNVISVNTDSQDIRLLQVSDGENQVFTLMPLYNQMLIGISYDESMIYEAKLKLRNTLLMISILLEIVVIVVGVSIYRKLSRPTALLIEQAERITNGDLDAPLPTTRDQGTSAIIDALQSVLNERYRLFIQTIEAISITLEKRDSYTAGHSKRVTEYALAIADELQLTDKEKRDLQLGAALHDIGKIGVPDRVLHKTGRLTPEEFHEIKQHPVYGDEIITNIKSLNHIRPIVRSHHERWDGGGYPDGISGEEIHLLARITCVADTFDAMTSDRPYRKGMSEQQASTIIKSESGKQFDPVVVEAFMKWKSKEMKDGSQKDIM
ncbi:HD domain-containing phosphohydrolase [Bacillus sp. PS06]|uniref:HD domain-containing phosphohydrolase n=1 Tax=Bacillus sp. PS06 TaxID=2764176 RepID=UPI001782C6EC|nr:HD domain-containing phosphohydrolase [Bacillus sp. PS06]MBD8070567.1 HD domain-containing protein [Bacillus sp. PS06]